MRIHSRLLGLFFAITIGAVLPEGVVDASQQAEQATVTTQDRKVYRELLDRINDNVHVSTLDNGLTVVCIPQKHTNEAIVSMTYNAGFVHEKPHEFGMAHLVEHMIFKGTTTMREGDLDKIAQKLGISITDGGLNANTFFNRTHYYFRTDAQNWRSFVNIAADCAQNMDWDSSVLDSELAAIFQEIKMRGDDRAGSDDEVISSWLPDNHPYKHRGIGYKEQLLSFSREDVLAFYHKYYTPDRAVLMVVGNVDPAEVAAHAQQAFAGFAGTAEPEPEIPAPFFNNYAQTNRVVYDADQKYMYSYVWQAPARHTADEAALDYIAAALQKRLKQDWVDEKGWCLMVIAAQQNLRDTGFMALDIAVKPEHKDVPFDQLLATQVQDIIEHGITEDEYTQVHKTAMRNLINFAEFPLFLSNTIKESFFPDVGAQGWYTAASYMNTVTHEAIRTAAHQYLRPFLMHTVQQVPLPEAEQVSWVALQQKTDAHERALLEQRARQVGGSQAEHREAPVFPERHHLQVIPDPAPEETFTLSNGLKVYYIHNDLSPTLSCSLVLSDLQGRQLAWGVRKKKFATEVWPTMVMHGTQGKSKKEIDDAFSRRGISCIAGGGVISLSMLKQDTDDALGLLAEVLAEPRLPEDILARKKQEFVQQIEMNKNNPRYQIGQKLKETLYGSYPWNFSQEESVQQVERITRTDVLAFHQVMTDPSRVACVVVGDVAREELVPLLEKHLACLNGVEPGYAVPVVPSLAERGTTHHIELPIEEVMVRMLRPTVKYGHSDYGIHLMLGDYLAGEVFNIREDTGLFYTCGALLIPGSNRLTADLIIGTQTGPTRVAAAQERIVEMLQGIHQNGITADEFGKMKDRWLHKDAKYTHTNGTMGSHLSSCVVNQHSWQHNQELRAQIEKLTFEHADQVIRAACDPATWTIITAGRLEGAA